MNAVAADGTFDSGRAATIFDVLHELYLAGRLELVTDRDDRTRMRAGAAAHGKLAPTAHGGELSAVEKAMRLYGPPDNQPGTPDPRGDVRPGDQRTRGRQDPDPTLAREGLAEPPAEGRRAARPGAGRKRKGRQEDTEQPTMTQEMADWMDARDTVTREFDKVVQESREREAKLMDMGAQKAADAEATERGRLVLKHDRWKLDHEARRPETRNEAVARRRRTPMATKKTLYLANPYGFSTQQRNGPLAELVHALTATGAEVWEPFARNNNEEQRSGKGWAYRLGQADLKDIRNADGLFAVVNGCPPDEGVMVELGMAIALNKPTFLFRDDMRRCTDCETYPVNLMLFTGLPATGWEEYWYSSVEEITDPRKALACWVRRKERAAARTQ